MIFRKIKEMQGLIDSSRKNLKSAERKIADMEKQAEALYEENKDLRFENEELKELIKRIEKLISSNKYNNEKAVLDKIKELVRDYQSIN